MEQSGCLLLWHPCHGARQSQSALPPVTVTASYLKTYFINPPPEDRPAYVVCRAVDRASLRIILLRLDKGVPVDVDFLDF
jgi:hypothetical protein